MIAPDSFPLPGSDPIERRPPETPRLCPFVACLWELRGDGTDFRRQRRLLPVLRCDLVLHGDGPIHYDEASGTRHTVAGGHLFGLRQTPVAVSRDTPHNVVGVTLTAAGAMGWLRAPLGTLAGLPETLDRIRPGLAAFLWDRWRSGSTPASRRRALEAALLETLAPDHLPSEEDLRMVRAFEGVQEPIRQWCRQVGIHPRTLERLFFRHVGLPPKVFQRIGRFRRTLGQLLGDPTRSVATLAQDHAYSDQSHLDREFRQFAGGSPSRFRADGAGIPVPPLRSHEISGPSGETSRLVLG